MLWVAALSFLQPYEYRTTCSEIHEKGIAIIIREQPFEYSLLKHLQLKQNKYPSEA